MDAEIPRRSGLLHGELTERIIGVFYEVHRELFTGFRESVYSRAMRIALREAGLSALREHRLNVHFRGRTVGRFRCDLLVEDRLLLEVKARRRIEPDHEAQLLNYLRATNIEVGLVLNFGPRATFRRMVYANSRKRHPQAP